jgi:MATE family multidrug resistance protein
VAVEEVHGAVERVDDPVQPRVALPAGLVLLTEQPVRERRTVTITGQPTPAARRSQSLMESQLAQPERLGLWAFLLGLFGGVIALMTDIPEVRATAAEYLLWPVLMPMVSVWAYTYDGVYLAATRTKIMRNTMIASLLIFLALLYTLMPLFGNAGLWTALAIFLGCRGLLLHLFFPRVLRAI